MIIDVVNKLIKPITIIALISIITTWAFNIQNTLVTDQTINGINIKVIDIRIYINNINNAWQTNALNFEDILPSRTWQTTSANMLQAEFWNTLINNIALVFDWIYFPINFILWLLRWLCWLLKLALALIGWNVGYTGTPPNEVYYSQLIQTLVWITQELMIPYV